MKDWKEKLTLSEKKHLEQEHNGIRRVYRLGREVVKRDSRELEFISFDNGVAAVVNCDGKAYSDRPTGEDLANLYGIDGEHPDYRRSDWQYEVANGGTHLGYWDWVSHIIESDSN